MTETNPKIAFIKALQKAQKEFPSLGKSKHVDNGKFGYDYLPLEQMVKNFGLMLFLAIIKQEKLIIN